MSTSVRPFLVLYGAEFGLFLVSFGFGVLGQCAGGPYENFAQRAPARPGCATEGTVEANGPRSHLSHSRHRLGSRGT